MGEKEGLEQLADATSLACVAADCPTDASAAPTLSIYDLFPLRWRILLVAATTSTLTPFSDTIVLPALVSMRASLSGSSDDSDAAIVSVYMAAVGLLTLVWGPLSDAVGRRTPLLMTLAFYLVFTIACIWADSAWVLVGLRACQGAFVGSTISITLAVVADVFPPAERGSAMGLFFVPLLVGPIVAPIVGGAIAEAALSWRGVFVLLAALGCVIFCLISGCLPETQQWHALCSRRAADPALPPIREPILKPMWHAPWQPLSFLLEAPIAPYAVVSGFNFGVMFTGLPVFPAVLSAPTFSLSTAAVGACYLPIGVAMMLGSLAGGVLSDRAGARDPLRVSARLVPSLVGALVCMPAGALVFGLAFQYGSLGGGIVGHVLLGLGQSIFNPGFNAYITGVKQSAAAGASAASMALNFVCAGVFISVAVPIKAQLGLGVLFAIFAAVNGGALAWAAIDLTLRSRGGGGDLEGDVCGDEAKGQPPQP